MADATVEKLREEIIESQKSRLDLLKWKIILVAALGAAAFGVSAEKGTGGVPSLLALVPLVCLFVDIVCHHTDVRIMFIGSFLRTCDEPTASAYERYCSKGREYFTLENGALTGTTLAVSVLIIVMGGFLLWDLMTLAAFGITGGSSGLPPHPLGILFVSAGGVTIPGTIYFHYGHKRKVDVLNNVDARNVVPPPPSTREPSTLTGPGGAPAVAGD